MRRIYESNALRREDDDQFAPSERDRAARPRAMRSVPASWLSRLVVPRSLVHRAISVSIDAPATSYRVGEPVPFRVTVRNPLPVPVTVATRSAVPWTWSVDGLPEASHVPRYDPPAEAGELSFDRGERKRFTRRWHQRFRVTASEWEPADPGTYTLGAALDVADAAAKGLSDEVTVEIRQE